jgi:hypothetical protein
MSVNNLNVTVSSLDADINAIKANVATLTAENSALAAENSAIKAENSVLASSNALLSLTLQAFLADPWRYLPPSTCAISQSPRQLAKSFKTFATFASADGTVYLIAEQDTQSVLYKYDGFGTFVSYQTLWSPATQLFNKVHTFIVDSVRYVALPFFSDGTNREYRCELFTFNETTRLLMSAQNISTFGVTGVSSVTAQNGVTYLAVSNYQNQAGMYNISSYIMRYNNATKLFEHFQNVTTIGAYPPEFYQFSSDTFLTIPNLYDGTTNLLDSVIYKLDATSGRFSLNQSIPTNGATHMKPWTRNSQQYLTVINWNGSYTDIFMFNGSQGQFVNVTSGNRMYFSKALGADVVDIAGSTYMAVTRGFRNDAPIYKWNDELTRFEQTQQITVFSGWYYPHFFAIGTDTFLTLSDRIYKFCGGRIVLV